MVNQWDTQAEASLDIQRQIVAKYGAGDVLDDLQFQVLPCPDKRSGKTLTCIVAYPLKEGAQSDNVMAALYE